MYVCVYVQYIYIYIYIYIYKVPGHGECSFPYEITKMHLFWKYPVIHQGVRVAEWSKALHSGCSLL